MNIALLTPIIPDPQKSGTQIRLYYLSRSLSRKHCLDLIYIGPSLSEILPSNITKLFSRVILLKPHKVSLLRRIVSILIFRAFTADVALVRELRQIFKNKRYDVVITAKTMGGFYYECTKVKQKFFTVLEEGGGVHHLYYRRQAYRAYGIAKLHYTMQWLKMKLYEKSLVKKFNLVNTVSEKEKEIIHSMIGNMNRVLYVPNGVDLDSCMPRTNDSYKNCTHVIFIGSYGYEPNIEAARYLVRILLPLLNELVSVVLIGEGPPADIVRAAQDNRRIQVTGFVDNLRPYFEQAIAFVNPMWGGAGTRLKILNAMAMSCPVISSAIGAEGIACEHNKNILIAEKPEEFACYIELLRQNPEIAKTIGQGGRELIEINYQWENIFKDFEEHLIRSFLSDTKLRK